MSGSLSDIRALALGLETDERLELAQSLIESVGADGEHLSSAWTQEIQRRRAALDAGDAVVISAADVFPEAKARVGQRSCEKSD